MDSGFNSEHPSLFVSENSGSLIMPGAATAAMGVVDGLSGTGDEVPSDIFGGGGGGASEIGSDFLAHYGLDGPISQQHKGEEEEGGGGGGGLLQDGHSRASNLSQHAAAALAAAAATAAASGLGAKPGGLGLPPPLPSSSTVSHARRRRKEEAKQATIRQHYYPEGGWGYVVVVVGFLAQLMTHGLQMSFGVLLLVLLHRWDSPSAQPFSHLAAAQLQQQQQQLSVEGVEAAASRVAVAIRSYRWIEAGRPPQTS